MTWPDYECAARPVLPCSVSVSPSQAPQVQALGTTGSEDEQSGSGLGQ